MRPAFSHKRATQTGMTLVEVMMAMVLTAILLVGMNALWVEISREVDALVLRQKAIFRLNGEMERLTGLYAAGSLAVIPEPTGSAIPVTNYNTTGAPTNQGDYIGTTTIVPPGNTKWEDESADVSGMRLIYPPVGATTVPGWMNNNNIVDQRFDDQISDIGADTFSYGVGAVKSIDTIFSRILYWDAGTANKEDDRNIVWIDRDKNIVGQISWSSVKLIQGTYPCGMSTPCRHITLYLDYPFRYSSAASPKEEISGFPVNTITLQTIVSQRP